MNLLDKITRAKASRFAWGGAFLVASGGYAWALQSDHALTPVFSLLVATLLTLTLISFRSAPGRTQWIREPDPANANLREELAQAKAVVAELSERVQEATNRPEDLAAAMTQVDELRAELTEAKRLLHEARSESPSLEQLLNAAWVPGEGTSRSPKDEAEMVRLREALQSSERELRRTREDLAALVDDDPSRVDERVREVQEQLRRSEAERALLRAGRPETVWEVKVHELERRLRSAEARASAIGSLSDGDAEMVARIEAAEVGRLAAEDRALGAEERAMGVEMRAKELAREVKGRFAEAEKSWQVTAAGELARLRTELEETAERLREAEERTGSATAAEGAAAAPPDPSAVDQATLAALEERVELAERRAQEAELLLRDIFQTDEERAVIEASELRRRLSRVTGQRKIPGPIRAPLIATPDSGPLDDLREAVAYELRGPVASLRGLALALKGAVSTADGRDLVRQLGTSTRKIDQLVSDLSDVAKLAEGAITLRRRRIDVSALVTRVVEEADGFENRILLFDGEPTTVSVDPRRVEQIVDSLLGNAKGRTTRGQTIRVHVGPDDDGGVLITVDDDGRATPEIGTELSLAIRLAEAHAGRLWMESLDKGASFRVELRPPATAGAKEASA